MTPGQEAELLARTRAQEVKRAAALAVLTSRQSLRAGARSLVSAASFVAERTLKIAGPAAAALLRDALVKLVEDAIRERFGEEG